MPWFPFALSLSSILQEGKGRCIAQRDPWQVGVCGQGAAVRRKAPTHY